jgi:hypothetical protein
MDPTLYDERKDEIDWDNEIIPRLDEESFLSKLREEIDAKTPTPTPSGRPERTDITKLRPGTFVYTFTSGSFTDKFGNTYASGIRFGVRWNCNIASYEVSEYSKLTAKVTVETGIREDYVKGSKLIFYSDTFYSGVFRGDEDPKIIYETTELSSLTQPLDITIDLTEVEILVIECYFSDEHTEVVLADAYLE